MPSNTHFTNCDICQKSIKSGEKFISLNLHKETGSVYNDKKSISVQFAVTTMKTCMACGRPLAAFVLSNDLMDEVKVRKFDITPPSPEKEYSRKEKHSEVEKVS